MARKFYLESSTGYQIGQTITLTDDEFVHIAKVMRFSVGEIFTLIDGFGYEYDCKIENINKKDMQAVVIQKTKAQTETNHNVTVFQALVKGDKFELITQKLTELGVNKIVPFESKFCQVKSNTTRLDRLEKISIEALKQCGRAKKVQIEKILSFDEMLKQLESYDKVIFAYENSTENFSAESFDKNDQNIAIVIGSEGGFSLTEMEKLKQQKNVKTVSLGKRILRAETAAISLTSVVMFLLNEWQV